MESKPASLGRERQLPWPPFFLMKLTRSSSSSEVQGPFFRPFLSQQGVLPIRLASSLLHSTCCLLGLNQFNDPTNRERFKCWRNGTIFEEPSFRPMDLSQKICDFINIYRRWLPSICTVHDKHRFKCPESSRHDLLQSFKVIYFSFNFK